MSFPFDGSWERAELDHLGSIFFLDDSNVNAANVVGGGTIQNPFTTGAYAVTQCTASAGDVIYVMAGHSQSVATLLALTSKALVTIMVPHLRLRWRMGAVSGSLHAPATDLVVSRATAGVPATTTTTIFNVVAGPVRVSELYGIVTTAIANTACTVIFTSTATGLSAVALSDASSSIALAAVGTIISITGTVADAAILSANQNKIAQAGALDIWPGTIRVTTSGSPATGQIQFFCRYAPLAPGSLVNAA